VAAVIACANDDELLSIDTFDRFIDVSRDAREAEVSLIVNDKDEETNVK